MPRSKRSAGDDIATGVSRLLSAANTVNATVVKATGGKVFGVSGYNASASARWLKIYDKASGVAETDTPKMTLYLAPTSYFNHDLHGFQCDAGISYRLTTAAADADTGALTAADVLGLNFFFG